MENSAPKRRRTSPRTSVPVVPEQQQQQQQQQPPQSEELHETSEKLKRPLERRENQPLQTSPGITHHVETPDSTGGLSQALKTQLDLRSVTRDALKKQQELQNIRGGDGNALKSPARRLNVKRATSQPLPPGDENPFARRGLRRSPVGSEVPPDENPFARRGLRRSPIGVVPQVIIPEPELPPTPERPDPVVSTPPSGIHNTPSRRPKRNRALAEKIKSSSPLKQPPIRPPSEDDQTDAPPEFKLASKKGQAPPPPPVVAEPTTAELRGLRPVDPDVERKKKLRDKLLAEIAELERDLNLASAENERLRQAHLAKQTPPPPPPNQTEILDLLERRALPPGSQKKKKEEPPPVPDWLSSALNPISFLPFNKPGTELPSLSSTATPDAAATLDSSKPIISHHPLPMTAEESLPFLQIFTPLSFTSTVFPLPRSEEPSGAGSSALFQKHFITASSTSPRGLFAARIEMTVNTKTLGVVELAVPRLDPNAVAELSPFVEKIVKKDCDGSGIPSSGLYNNVGVLTWAMGEWLRVSAQRAKVWNVLEGEVKDKERLREMVKWMRERKKTTRKKKRRRRRPRRGDEGDEDDEEQSDDENEGVEENNKKYYEARDLLPYMGKTCLDLEVPSLSGNDGGEVCALRVVWRIHFDWTGEARSEIGVLVGVPSKWHKHDERGQLCGIPRVFDELIHGGEEPLSAMRTVVSLLCGEQTG